MSDDANTISPRTPPHLVHSDFLDADEAEAVYAFACAHEADFRPTVTAQGEMPDLRVSTATHDLGPFKPLLQDRLRALLPDLIAGLRMDVFTPSHIELELAAHGDGAFFRRHIDTQTGQSAAGKDRVRWLSAVYYVHRLPQAWRGGALRLHPVMNWTDSADITPQYNALLVFPSWMPHEVRPVAVPSRRFADSRFAINCWFYKDR